MIRWMDSVKTDINGQYVNNTNTFLVVVNIDTTAAVLLIDAAGNTITSGGTNQNTLAFITQNTPPTGTVTTVTLKDGALQLNFIYYAVPYKVLLPHGWRISGVNSVCGFQCDTAEEAARIL